MSFSISSCPVCKSELDGRIALLVVQSPVSVPSQWEYVSQAAL